MTSQPSEFQCCIDGTVNLHLKWNWNKLHQCCIDLTFIEYIDFTLKYFGFIQLSTEEDFEIELT